MDPYHTADLRPACRNSQVPDAMFPHRLTSYWQSHREVFRSIRHPGSFCRSAGRSPGTYRERSPQKVLCYPPAPSLPALRPVWAQRVFRRIHVFPPLIFSYSVLCEAEAESGLPPAPHLPWQASPPQNSLQISDISQHGSLPVPHSHLRRLPDAGWDKSV